MKPDRKAITAILEPTGLTAAVHDPPTYPATGVTLVATTHEDRLAVEKVIRRAGYPIRMVSVREAVVVFHVGAK